MSIRRAPQHTRTYAEPNTSENVSAGMGAPTMVGGSEGLPSETAHDVTQLSPNNGVTFDDTPPQPVKAYRVLNGGNVMLDGMRTAIRVGKIVTELTHPIDLLKSQGIRLEEVTE